MLRCLCHYSYSRSLNFVQYWFEGDVDCKVVVIAVGMSQSERRRPGEPGNCRGFSSYSSAGSDPNAITSSISPALRALRTCTNS